MEDTEVNIILFVIWFDFINGFEYFVSWFRRVDWDIFKGAFVGILLQL